MLRATKGMKGLSSLYWSKDIHIFKYVYACGVDVRVNECKASQRITLSTNEVPHQSIVSRSGSIYDGASAQRT